MTGLGVRVTLIRPCVGPEVKGTSGYLTPAVVEWCVRPGVDGQPSVSAVVSGWGRKGTWSRGRAAYSVPGDHWAPEPPQWLPIPVDWITDAMWLVMSYPAVKS